MPLFASTPLLMNYFTFRDKTIFGKSYYLHFINSAQYVHSQQLNEREYSKSFFASHVLPNFHINYYLCISFFS